jgi:hypothetical protein
MVSVNVNCSCGRQFVTGIPSGVARVSIACPSCGAGHQMKPPGVLRDQFVAAAGAGQIKLTDYYKVWSSSVDGCSCSLCSKLEGTAVRLDETFEVAGRIVQEPPLHDGCRCAVLLVDGSVLEPWLVRLHKAFTKFSNAASGSVTFSSFTSCFFAAEYFLGQLASAPGADLVAASLSGNDLESQLRDLQLRRDQLFNAAIKRAFAHEWESARLANDEHARRAHMDRWFQLVVSTQALAPANYEYLKELFSNV